MEKLYQCFEIIPLKYNYENYSLSSDGILGSKVDASSWPLLHEKEDAQLTIGYNFIKCLILLIIMLIFSRTAKALLDHS